MPGACACCGGAPDCSFPATATRTRGTRRIRTEARTWSFPYCARCTRHVAAANGSWFWFIFISSLIVAGLVSNETEPAAGVPIVVAGLVVGLWQRSSAHSNARSMMSSGCASLEAAVAYAGWHGSVHDLEFASTYFASEFVRANAGKVVDAPMELVQPPPPPPRPAPTPPPVQYTPPAPMQAAQPRPPNPPYVAPRMVPRNPARPDGAVWLKRGHPTNVANYPIDGGLLYLGSGLSSVSGYRGTEPALIDPSLRVDHRSPARTGDGMTYWPSYSEISPQHRAAYLEWLAGGRRDPTAYIGYVFLYLYGLERRALYDALTSTDAKADLSPIAAEATRLLGIYRDNRSFHRYGRTFLDTLAVMTDSGEPTECPSEIVTGQLTSSVRVGLAKLVHAGRALPAAWAYAWVVGDPETRLRTPGTRCADELMHLFQLRYQHKFGAGMEVRPNRTKLVLRYQPASATFGGEISLHVGDLPDVSALSTPVNRLRSLLEECLDDLEPLSRLRGKRPGITGLATAAVMPAELVRAGADPDLVRLTSAIQKTLRGQQTAVVPASTLLDRWSTEKPTKADAVGISQLLERAGYGVEPDVRFGGKMWKSADELVVFPATGASARPSPSYAAAALLLHLSAAIATADGTADSAEVRHLHEHVRTALKLPPAEKARLGAHLQWLLLTKPKLTGIAKRIGELSAPQRAQVGDFLIGVAAADGKLSPAEVKVLEKVFKLLGLNAADLYRQIHTFGGDAPANATSALPQSGSVKLDMTRVKAKLEETAEVSALLGRIFVEEEVAPKETTTPGASSVRGLDAAHSHFVRSLLGRTVLTREDLEREAAVLALLPDGTVETLNEKAYDVVGNPLFDGEDPLTIDSTVLKELLA